MKRRTQVLAGLMGVAIIATLTYVAGWLSGEAGQALNPVSESQAAGGKVKDPAGVAPDRRMLGMLRFAQHTDSSMVP